MSSRRPGVFLASISAVALLAEAGVASAQPYDQSQPPPQGYDQGPPPGYNQAPPPPGYNQGPPPGYNQGQPPQQGYDQGPPQGQGGYNEPAPPSGQYAPPPPGVNGGSYDPQAQQYDQDYAQHYSAWAAQYCVDRRNNNTAAGATAGAAIGSSSTDTTGCPPGYVVAPGAPAFAYAGPYGGPGFYAPAWYNPWVWDGGHWGYRPYRSWYVGHPGYWRHGGGRRWRR